MSHLELSQLKLNFNNEVIKHKNSVLQAKTRTIHKLTRKAQQLKARKGSDEELEKFKKKADSIVSEILLIKVIKPHQLGRFAMRNIDKLDKIMDTPVVTQEKAMAKILSHKCLKSKFEKIVASFSVVPVEKLLEVNEKKLRKKKRKEKQKLLSAKEKSEKDASIEDKKSETTPGKNLISDDEEYYSDESSKYKNAEDSNDETSVSPKNDGVDEDSDEIENSSNIEENQDEEINLQEKEENENSDSENEIIPTIKKIKSNIVEKYKTNKQTSLNKNNKQSNPFVSDVLTNIKSKKKHKDETYEEKSCNVDKNTEKPEKTKPKKLKKMFVDMDDKEVNEINTEKIVDSFFVTDSGDNYLTMALPRPPDAISSNTNDDLGNRKVRRAAMFGNEIKPQVKKPKMFSKNENYNDLYGKGNAHFEPRGKGNAHIESTGKANTHFDAREKGSAHFDNKKKRNTDQNDKTFTKTDEKIHPSWEAKKKNTSIVAFQGKKVVFGDD